MVRGTPFQPFDWELVVCPIPGSERAPGSGDDFRGSLTEAIPWEIDRPGAASLSKSKFPHRLEDQFGRPDGYVAVSASPWRVLIGQGRTYVLTFPSLLGQLTHCGQQWSYASPVGPFVMRNAAFCRSRCLGGGRRSKVRDASRNTWKRRARRQHFESSDVG